MPVTYIERRRISRKQFIGFTPIGYRSVARGGFRGGQDFTSQAAVGDIPSTPGLEQCRSDGQSSL